MNLSTAVWTPHALEQIAERSLTREQVDAILAEPSRVDDVRTGRVVAMSELEVEGKSYLVRVFIDIDREPFEIVTVYRTSKIGKYWSRR